MRPGDGIFPWVKLTYVARPGTGHTPSRQRPELWDDSECTIPWFTLADIWQLRDGSVTSVLDTQERISRAGLANSAAVLHPAGTVLLSRTASVGFSAVMETDMAVSQDFMTWTPGPRLRSRYLLYVLRALRPHLLSLSYGSTHKTIYMPDLMALKTPVPPVAVQDRVVSFLDREMGRIQELEHELRDAEALVAEHLTSVLEGAIFKDGDDDWYGAARHDVRPLGALGSLVDGDWIESPYITDTGIRLVQTGNVGRGEFRGEAERYISEATFAELRCTEVQPGDVLFSRLNLPMGRACLAPGDLGRMVASVDVAILKPGSIINPEFLVALASTDRWLGELGQMARGTTMLRVARSQLARVRVPLPTNDEQNAIAALFREARTRAEICTSELSGLRDGLREYRESLVAEAVSGRLDVLTVSETEIEERFAAVSEGRPREVLT